MATDTARKAESLGMTRGPQRNKKMSEKGRIAVAKATRKPRGTYGFKKKKGGIVKKKHGGAVKKKK